MNTLVVIMAHHTDMFYHLLPQWEKHGFPIIVYCPTDSVPQTGHNVWAYGTAEHHGPMANRRFKNLFKQLARTDFQQFVIFEYDSLCLSEGIPQFTLAGWETVMCGNLFRDDRVERGFEGTTFIHPPLIIPHCYVEHLSAQLNTYADEAEQGFWDRLLGLAVEETRLPFVNFLAFNLGYARNTIEQHELGDAIAAVEQGAIFIHGIKRWSTFVALRDAHARSPKRCGLRVPL